MDYLRGNATASATGLFVICRHLAGYPDGRFEDELRRALQLLRGGAGSADEPAAVLTATLAVGENLGVLAKDPATSIWRVERSISKVANSGDNAWPLFRSELLHRISMQGVDAASGGDKTPDLVIGLTWFMQMNPLRPVSPNWNQTNPFGEYVLTDAVSRSEQWRPFVRWAVALGVARRSESSTPKVVIPDASTAIADQLASLPKAGSAHEWTTQLQDRLPIFGARTLTAKLPQGRAWDDLPAAVVLGLLKLEKQGILVLEASDDGVDVLTVGLGATSRQVGRIKVVKARV